MNFFKRVRETVREDIIKKPCTVLQYQVRETSSFRSKETIQKTTFFMKFMDPPRVRVMEEYLIFDLVAMISSIGGTMGLCIGISFKEVASYTMTYVRLAFDYIKRKNQDSREPSY